MNDTNHIRKDFCVSHWGSHPDDNNDDCWYSEEFETLAEAKAYFYSKDGIFRRDSSVAYFMLCGPGVETGGTHYEMFAVANPAFKPRAKSDDDMRHEQAMEAGMGLGCDAYNEVMGND